jgi:hypothetical protein
MDAVEVIAQCRSLGAVLVSEGDTLRVTAPEPLPDYLRELLRVNKTQVGLVLQLCQRSVCANPLTPHSTHEHPWECDPNSCTCFRLFGKVFWCPGAPCRWVWPAQSSSLR